VGREYIKLSGVTSVAPGTVVRALTSKKKKKIFFFVFYVYLKLSDDFLKNKKIFFGPNGENWSMENFDIFSAKIDFCGF
jgi:lysyl-tRNA synthetase class I